MLSPRLIIKKIKDLIRVYNNRPLFLYRIHHYLRIPVSRSVSEHYAKKNMVEYAAKGLNPLWFETYDGSNQICHPDILKIDSDVWMIATPYPYGLEEYENPCLFYGDSIENLKPIDWNPIARPMKNGYGSHLSDPCLFYDEKLFCIYRDTLNYGNRIENRICYRIFDKDKGVSDEKVILSSFDDGLLSPSVVKINGERVLFFVSYIDSSLKLFQKKLSNDMSILDGREVRINNLDKEWKVWHIDLKVINGKIIGLFLIRLVSEFKLIMVRYDYELSCFTVIDDIVVPEAVASQISHCYKSCIIQDGNKILFNFRDKNSVYVTLLLSYGGNDEHKCKYVKYG